MEWSGPREEGGYYWQMIEAIARENQFSLDAPVSSFPKKTCIQFFTAPTGRKSAWNFSAETAGNPPSAPHLRRRWQPGTPLPGDAVRIYPDAHF
jgi:hypothetical protein